uniref:Uncharacterized protein n=1 Tax=Siphoviridae sp. ctnpt50 TaxID=2827941 RepID=A0A8S5SE56_9CAUD|nr:MAG TPA: hypothetical protein [Siphoviridae sp. ctnpt50]
MKEIKLTIDGKEVQPTNEQLKMLGIEVRKNPFERVAEGKTYYRIDRDGKVDNFCEYGDSTDDALKMVNNYFNDESFASQVALRHLLYRKLLEFAYENDGEDVKEWDGSNERWTIRYGSNLNKFFAYSQERYKAPDVYFSSKEATERAINEVVEPFMEEHPDFIW